MNTYFSTLNNRPEDKFLTLKNAPRFSSAIDDILNEVLGIEHVSNINKSSLTPPVNIIENNAVFEVEMAVPGYDKSDIKIDLDRKF